MSQFLTLTLAASGGDKEIVVNMDRVLFITSIPDSTDSELHFDWVAPELRSTHGITDSLRVTETPGDIARRLS